MMRAAALCAVSAAAAAELTQFPSAPIGCTQHSDCVAYNEYCSFGMQGSSGTCEQCSVACDGSTASDFWPMAGGVWSAKCTTCAVQDMGCTEHEQCGTSAFCDNGKCTDCENADACCGGDGTKVVVKKCEAACKSLTNFCTAWKDAADSVGSAVIAILIIVPLACICFWVGICFCCGMACFSGRQAATQQQAYVAPYQAQPAPYAKEDPHIAA